MRRRPTTITFHLTPESVWAAQAALAEYPPEAIAREGLVQCTDGAAHVIEVGNRY